MAADPVPPMEEAIRLWSGVECPNPAGRRGLEDIAALLADLEALRGTLAFEDEPAGFDLALRAEKESEA